jgi:hypothetical protein
VDLLSAEQEVPTEEDLVTSRDRRDLGWGVIRSLCLHSDWPAIQANSFIDGECADSDLAYTYEGVVTQCDDIGDRYRQPGLLANLLRQILQVDALVAVVTLGNHRKPKQGKLRSRRVVPGDRPISSQATRMNNLITGALAGK